MSIGVSLFLIAVGAILAFAVEAEAEGLDLDAIGYILMIVGVVGLLLSGLFWNNFSPYRRGAGRRVIVEEDDYV